MRTTVRARFPRALAYTLNRSSLAGSKHECEVDTGSGSGGCTASLVNRVPCAVPPTPIR